MKTVLWTLPASVSSTSKSILLILILLGASCSKSGVPTTPTPAPTVVPPIPASLRVRTVTYRTRAMTIDWAASPGASSYRVLVGTTALGSQLGQFTTTATSFDLRDLPTSQRASDTMVINPSAYICVQALNEGENSGCATRAVVMPDFRDVADALFFSQGPYRDRSDSIPARAFWYGFRAGATVLVRLSSNVTPAHAAAVRRLVDHFNELMPELYQIAVQESGQSLESIVLSSQFVAGQVLIAEVSPDDIRATCGNGAFGCAPFRTAAANGELFGAKVLTQVANSDRIVQHELGHALFGLAHAHFIPPATIDSFDWFEYQLMGTGYFDGVGRFAERFSGIEAELFQGIREAGLLPGHSRTDFAARGMVN